MLIASMFGDCVPMYKLFQAGHSCGETNIAQKNIAHAIGFGHLLEGTCSDRGFTEAASAQKVLDISFIGPVTFRMMQTHGSSPRPTWLNPLGFLSQFLWHRGMQDTAIPQPVPLHREKATVEDGSNLRGDVSRRSAVAGLAAAIGAGLPSSAAVAKGPPPPPPPPSDFVLRADALRGNLAMDFVEPSHQYSWRLKAPSRQVSDSKWVLNPLKNEQIWRLVKKLPETAQNVVLYADWEPPFFCQSPHWNNPSQAEGYKSTRPGVYVSAVTGIPLFHSSTKSWYDQGIARFSKPFDPSHIITRLDPADMLWSEVMTRVEMLDARSGAHIGHVFDDGASGDGKFYVVEMASMNFVPEEDWDDYLCSVCEKKGAYLDGIWSTNPFCKGRDSSLCNGMAIV